MTTLLPSMTWSPTLVWFAFLWYYLTSIHVLVGRVLIHIIFGEMSLQIFWTALNLFYLCFFFFFNWVLSIPNISFSLGNLQIFLIVLSSVQFGSVTQLCPTLCDPMNHSMPGLPVHHQLPEFTQTHIHRVSDAIQPSHPLSSPSPPAPNPSQHQSLFQWVNSLHEVAKVLEFQL